MACPFAAGGITPAFAQLFFRNRKRLPAPQCFALLFGHTGMAAVCGGNSAAHSSGGGAPAGNSALAVTATSDSGSRASCKAPR